MLTLFSMQYGPVPYHAICNGFAYTFTGSPECMSLRTFKKTSLTIPGNYSAWDASLNGITVCFDTGLYFVVEDQVTLIDDHHDWTRRGGELLRIIGDDVIVYDAEIISMERMPLHYLDVLCDLDVRFINRILGQWIAKDNQIRTCDGVKYNTNARFGLYDARKGLAYWLYCKSRNRPRAQAVLNKSQLPAKFIKMILSLF